MSVGTAKVSQLVAGTGRMLVAALWLIPSGYTPRWIAMMLLRFSLYDSDQGRKTNAWLERR